MSRLKRSRAGMWLGAVVVALLTACTSLPKHPVTQTWQKLEGATMLVLNRPVTIPAGQSSVVIQDGEVSPAGRDRYRPFCELSIDRLPDAPVTIAPDRFRIEHVKGQTLYTGTRQRFPLLVVANGRLQLAMDGDDTLPIDVTEAWRMRLSSERQPHVVLLLCGGVEDNLVELAQPPTLAQIRSALGAVATLR